MLYKTLSAAVYGIDAKIKMPIDTVNRTSQQAINAADAYTRTDMNPKPMGLR